jgi:two-component system response regulator MprA
VEARILVIDDDDTIRELLREALSDEFEVHLAADDSDGFRLMVSAQPDVMIVDLVGRPDSSIAIIKALERDGRRIPFLLLSAALPAHIQREADRHGAAAWLAKPFDVDELIATLRRILSATKG